MITLDQGIVTKSCPFCGWQPKASFKWVRSMQARNEYGNYRQKCSYRIAFICRRCHSRGRPVTTEMMFESPYMTSFYGRYKEHASDVVDRADIAYEPYIRKAAEYWNSREGTEND